MKVIIEGSPSDIRAAMFDAELVSNSGRNELLLEQSLDRETDLENQVEGLQKREVSQTELGQLKMELAKKSNELAAAVNEISALKVQLNNPVRLTAIQQAELETLFEESVKEFSTKNLVFKHPLEANVNIKMSDVFETVFGLISSGKKVQAIKAIREASGLGLQKSRDLIDNALRAYGCSLDPKGAPQTIVKSA